MFWMLVKLSTDLQIGLVFIKPGFYPSYHHKVNQCNDNLSLKNRNINPEMVYI